MNKLNDLKDEYQNIEIPEKLEFVIRTAIKKEDKHMRKNRIIIKSFASAAAFILVFTATVNLSPSTAFAMEQVPILGSLVRLVSFSNLTYQDDIYEADIDIPRIEGLEDVTLQNTLNQKYLKENTQLFNDFLVAIGDKKIDPSAFGLYTNYKVKTETEDIFVVESVKTEIAASGAESVHYDNIDLKNQIIISLPSLFTDDNYIDVISNYLNSYMQEHIKIEEGIMYFLEINGDVGGFDKIGAEQSFYITAESKLVIVFNEYEVAPGSMGIVEFTIPTDVLKDILVSDVYIK